MSPGADRSPRRHLAHHALLLAAMLAACSGCLVDVRLGADGSGALMLRYHLDERQTLGAAAERLASPAVVVRSARIDAQGRGTFKATFADVQALSSTAMFKNVSITRVPGTEPATTTVIAKFVQPKPITLSPELLQRHGNELKVVLALPGPIVASNATTHEPDVATWVVPLQTLLAGGETVFSVTYRDPAAGRAAGSA